MDLESLRVNSTLKTLSLKQITEEFTNKAWDTFINVKQR